MPKDAQSGKSDRPDAPERPEGRKGDEDAGGPGKFIPELIRRGLTLGFTGIFMTEEALRRALGDSVPRDMVEFVLEQSERTRAELLDRLSKEFGRVLSAVDPVEMAKRLLEGRTVEVTARVRLISPDEEKTDGAESK